VYQRQIVEPALGAQNQRDVCVCECECV
jgi:hypothetical protein